MKTYHRLAVACLAGSLSFSAQADLSINGFATLAGGMTLSDEDELYGYDDTFSFKSNSLMGLQVDADLGEGLTATAQITAKGADQWDTEFSWAYIGYEVNDNLKFLVGRQRIPYYQYSDFVDIGYAYHWIAPPEETYSIPFDNTDGIGAILTNELGPFSSTLHLVYGRLTEEVEGNDLDSKNQISGAWNMNWDWLTFRLGYSQSDIQLGVPQVEAIAGAWELAGFPEFVPPISVTDDNNSGSYTNFGVTVDYDNLLIVTEITEQKLEGTPFAESRGSYYASFGYRFDSIMPHFTFGAVEQTPSDYSFLDAVPSGVSPQLDALAGGTVQLFESSREDLEYYIIGVRWDFHSSAALKVDYKSLKNTLTDENTNLLRFAISTVF